MILINNLINSKTKLSLTQSACWKQTGMFADYWLEIFKVYVDAVMLLPVQTQRTDSDIPQHVVNTSDCLFLVSYPTDPIMTVSPAEISSGIKLHIYKAGSIDPNLWF